MARLNGGIVGAKTIISGGGNTITSKTSTGALTTQAGTTLVDVLVVAGGGGGGVNGGGGGGAGGVRLINCISVCGSTPYTMTVGGGGNSCYPTSATELVPAAEVG